MQYSFSYPYSIGKYEDWLTRVTLEGRTVTIREDFGNNKTDTYEFASEIEAREYYLDHYRKRGTFTESTHDLRTNKSIVEDRSLEAMQRNSSPFEVIDRSLPVGMAITMQPGETVFWQISHNGFNCTYQIVAISHSAS